MNIIKINASNHYVVIQWFTSLLKISSGKCCSCTHFFLRFVLRFCLYADSAVCRTNIHTPVTEFGPHIFGQVPLIKLRPLNHYVVI